MNLFFLAIYILIPYFFSSLFFIAEEISFDSFFYFSKVILLIGFLKIVSLYYLQNRNRILTFYILLLLNLFLFFFLAIFKHLNILLNVDLILYTFKQSTLLVSDLFSLMNRIGTKWIYLFFISSLGYILLVNKMYAIRKEIYRKKIFYFIFGLYAVIAIFIWKNSFFSQKKEFVTENKNSKQNEWNLSKKNLVIFLLESVNQKEYKKNPSKYFKDEIEYFFVPVPHTSFSIYSLFTSEYVQGEKLEFRYIDESKTLNSKLKAFNYELNFFYTEPSNVEKLNELLPKLGFTLKDKFSYQNYESFSWGVDDIALLHEAENLSKLNKNSFTVYAFSNTHSPYFCANDLKLKNEYARFQCALRYDIQVVDKIIETYLETNSETIFILLADHGESFGEHGFWKHDFSLYNEEIRVPFYVFQKNQEVKLPRIASVLDFQEIVLGLLENKKQIQLKNKFRLKLNSWNTDDFKGVIEDNKKYIYEKKSNQVFEMDLDDRNIKIFSSFL